MMGAKREEVEIEPLQAGSKGFLGLIGKKPATVRATLRADDRIRTLVFIRNILAKMDIKSALDVKEDGDTITIVLDETASTLIGHRGQTLDALQYLIARYLNDEKDDWRKVVVDIDNYRDRREDNLRGLAERLANQAIRSQRNIKTEPLTAPERRIIHMTLKENSEVTTFSVGSGARKRVVIATNSGRNDSNRRRPSGDSPSSSRTESRGDRGESRGDNRGDSRGGNRPRRNSDSRGDSRSSGGRPLRSSGSGGRPYNR